MQPDPQKPAHTTDDEWALRCELAECYRLIDYFGWTETIFNHISARLPGPAHHYLVNPFGLNYNEITPANLLKVDLNGHKVEDSPTRAIQPASPCTRPSTPRARTCTA